MPPDESASSLPAPAFEPASEASASIAAPSVVLAPGRPPRQVRRFRMELCFDGTEYHGWQRQANGITVQEVLEDRVKKLFGGCHIAMQGSSRTDAGVHALGMVVSFDAPESPYIPDWKIKKALNRLLPPSIKVREVSLAEPKFNARNSAYGKAYAYVVNTGDLNPFTSRWSWHMTDCKDIPAMEEAIKAVVGTHDFSSFTTERGAIDDPVRSIFKTEIKTFGPLICLHFIGDGFLYKMVRGMTGTIVDVGRGKIPASDVAQILDACDRCAARDTAPAEGLFLLKVFYDHASYEAHSLDKVPFFML